MGSQCAMADGTILSWHDGMDENTVLGKLPDWTSPGTGNSVTGWYGDEKVIYCHLQKFSMRFITKGWSARSAK